MAWGEKDYQTWINHFLIAGVLTFVFSLVLPVQVAGALAVWGYAFRECDQQLKKWEKKKSINVLDAVLDVAAPTLSAMLIWLWLR
jgi:heme/copper-type cytochrome/quinol oxidase subunit 2